MPRLFVALDPPEEVKDALDRLCEGLPGHPLERCRPVPPDLALHRRGRPGHLLRDRRGPGRGSATRRSSWRSRASASSRRAASPHTLWAGVEDPTGGVASLRRRIERALAEVGVPPERRKFAPHVTLGRFRGPPPEERLASWLFRRNLFRSARFPVSSFGLYASQLRPEGSLYTLEAEYDFVAGVVERV